MNRSKLFLSLTAVVLGVAAFAASKVKFNSVTGCTALHTQFTQRPCSTATGAGNFCTTGASGHARLYTCTNFTKPLYTKAG